MLREPIHFTLSIGRNVGDTPMSDADWDTFKGAVSDLLRYYAATIFSDAEGTGQYDGADETCHIWQGRLPEDSYSIRTAIGHLAYLNRQDGIGFMVVRARDSFIHATP